MALDTTTLTFNIWQKDKYLRVYIDHVEDRERRKLGYIDLKSGKVGDADPKGEGMLLAALEAEGITLNDVLREFVPDSHETAIQEVFPDSKLPPVTINSRGELVPTAYRIYYDGGCEPNPGPGYGSYAFFVADSRGSFGPHEPPVYRDYTEYGTSCTNNIAEYTALISGLKALISRLEEQGIDPTVCLLDVWGDSDLTVKQITGEFRISKPHLATLCDEAVELLDGFGEVKVRHHYRVHSLMVLGH